MKHRTLCAIALVGWSMCAATTWGQPVANAIYQTDFERADAGSVWSGAGKLERSATRGMTLAVRGGVAQLSLPCEEYRGSVLLLSALVKAEGVADGFHVVRCSATVAAPSGGETFQAAVPGGTYDWRQAAVRIFVPWDATRLTVMLGLDAAVAGKVWFDDVRIDVRINDAIARGKAPMDEWTFPRLRGAMIDPRGFAEADVNVLAGEWKANVVRWQMLGAPSECNTPADIDAYHRWLASEIKRLDAMLPTLRKYGVYTLIDMHSPPGGSAWEGGGLFSRQNCQQVLVDAWKTLAKHYKGVAGVYGYDIANEPIDVFHLENVGYDTVAGDVYNWWELGDKISRAIREIDPTTPIIFEPSPGGVTYAFRNLHAFNIRNVVYSLHMYMPYQFTHQRVLPCFPDALRYPGFTYGGEVWDQPRVARELQQVIDFQKKYDARIFVGEFSAVRWAPDDSAFRYLTDNLAIFEREGWDWTYHAFRENACWSVEHTTDKDNPKVELTNRQQLLRSLFEKNAPSTLKP